MILRAILIAVAVPAACTGCHAPQVSSSIAALAIPTEPKALSYFELVNHRYLIQPVVARNVLTPQPTFGGSSVGLDAWSGLHFGSGDYAPIGTVNVRVIDIETGRHGKAFESDRAVGSWRPDFRADRENRRIETFNKLIILARGDDTNADQRIDAPDQPRLYVLDLETLQRTRLSRDGEAVSDFRTMHDRILILTESPGEPQIKKLYSCDSRTLELRCLIDRLDP